MEKSRFRRSDRLIQERRHDAYRDRGKAKEGTACGSCGAVFLGGRWTWGESPGDRQEATCPACQRTADKFPAGFVRISGEFFSTHREEILNLARNAEEQEKADHPMERIMEVREDGGEALVTTTGIHLARRIGESLSRSYQGELSLQYEDGEARIRVSWAR